MKASLLYLAQLVISTLGERISDNRRYAGKHMLMFWSHTRRPQDYANKTTFVAPGDVLTAIAVMRSGEVLERWMGWAECRICGETLGTKDMTAFDFVWPEKAEHYIEAHGVWAPGVEQLVASAKQHAKT